MTRQLRRATALLLALLLGMPPLAGALPELVAHAEVVAPPPTPPALGAIVSEQPLTSPGVFSEDFCPTGRGSGRTTDEGYRLTLNGRCLGRLPTVNVHMPVQSLTLLDGDVEFSLAGGGAQPRAVVSFLIRLQPGGNGYQLDWNPTTGVALLQRLREGRPEQLVHRDGLTTVALEDGARVAVRVQGPSFWLLVNDVPIFAGTDPGEDGIDSGRLAVGLIRAGDPDDDAEISLLLRSMRVSQLAESESTRLSMFQEPGNTPFRPAPGTPPAIGAVLYEEPMNQKEYAPYRLSMFIEHECPTGNGSMGFVEDGFRMAVRGKCFENSRVVSVGLPPNSFVNVPDGEVRMEFKIRHELRRAFISLGMRVPDQQGGRYFFVIAPSLGLAAIERAGDGGDAAILARRNDIGGVVRRNDWNSLAVRVHGSHLWLVLNDQPVLSAQDGQFSQGSFTLSLRRVGDPGDSEAIDAVFRNLSISEIKGSPRNRRPHGLWIDFGRQR
jgi:hypothetical protein